MLRTLIEYLISIVELFEAEAKAVKRGIIKLGLGLALIVVATFLLAGGFGLLIGGFYLWLAMMLPPAAALAIDGAAVMLLAGGLLWKANRLAR